MLAAFLKYSKKLICYKNSEMVCERTQPKIFQIVFPEVIQSNDNKCVFKILNVFSKHYLKIDRKYFLKGLSAPLQARFL